MKYLWLGFLTLAVAAPYGARAADQLSHYDPCGKPEYSYAGADKMFESHLTPGIPWPAYADLLGLHWTEAQIQQDKLFDPLFIMQAITEVTNGKPAAPSYEKGWQEYENFQPAGASDIGKDAYAAAAAFYRDGKWAEAITRFDAVSAITNSPYRAAAAYTAARSALNLGDYKNALTRLDKLATDPTLHEYQIAALHLIGTRAWQSGSPELIAAHYVEIEHLLLAAPSIICHDPVATSLLIGDQQRSWDSGGWSSDLLWYLDTAFPTQYANYARRDALDKLALHDSFLDLIRALAAPAPYGGDSGWLSVAAEPKASHDDVRDLALKDSDEITSHARDQWLKTKNVLWGYALAQRTAELTDLPLIKDMIVALANTPHTAAVDYAQNAFHRHFVQHAVRILLLNDKTDEALQFLHENLRESDQQADVGTPFNDTSAAILNGGIRLFLEKFDLPGARRWATEVGALFPYTEINQQLRPLLAASYDELLDNHVPGDGRNVYGLPNHESYRGTIPRAIWDLLSTQKILALSEHTGLTEGERRALLSSGWLRTVLLEGKKQGLTLLPQLRKPFPELATDIDDISGAWLHSSKQHLLTRLMLRVPGFSPRPSWARTDLPENHDNYYAGMHSGSQNIFAIDSGNPNDGNWWCSVDSEQVKIDMAEAFFVEPLRGRYQRSEVYEDPNLPQLNYYASEEKLKKHHDDMIVLADKLIAWHPLLKDADLKELDQLSHIENGPKLLSEQVLAWVRKSNWLTRHLGLDKYLPETLHLAVRSTRYGCRREGPTGTYSHSAWNALHKLYPQSEWMKQTPYWFNIGEVQTDGDLGK